MVHVPKRHRKRAVFVVTMFVVIEFRSTSTSSSTSTPPLFHTQGPAADPAVVKLCPAIHSPANGTVTLTIGKFGPPVIEYSCDEGFSLRGSKLNFCSPSLTLVNELPTCEQVCPNITTDGGASPNASTALPGESVAFTCKQGYSIFGPPLLTCLSNVTWSHRPPVCIRRQCTQTSVPDGVIFNKSTVYVGEMVEYSCRTGLTRLGPLSVECLQDGTWSHGPPTCIRLDCPLWSTLNNGNVSFSVGETIQGNSTLTLNFTCDRGYMLQGHLQVICQTDGRWSSPFPNCVKEPTFSAAGVTASLNGYDSCIAEQNTAVCAADIDFRHAYWTEALSGQTVIRRCGEGYEGLIQRECAADGTWLLPRYDCTSEHVLQIVSKLHHADKLSVEEVTQSLEQLGNATRIDATNGTGLQAGDLQSVTAALVSVSQSAQVSEQQTNAFVSVANNLLDEVNTDSWQSMLQTPAEKHTAGPEAATILMAMETFTGAIAKKLEASNGTQRIAKSNIIIEMSTVTDTTEAIQLHDRSRDEGTWINHSASGLYMAPDTVENLGITSYSSAIYRNLSLILQQHSSSQTLNSAIMSFQVNPNPYQQSPNVTLTFQALQNGYSSPTCSYWNFTSGDWSSDGCEMVATDNNITVCQCSHLTNFAILMSPWMQRNVDSTALDIISIVGCSLSTLGILVTCLIHIALWSYVKSDRVVILLNVCFALLASYATFILGVDRTENKDLCTGIAALLQYIYLVVFCLLLVDGIEIAVAVLYVFSTRSRLKWLLPLAWGLPAVIVGASLGATQLKGFGTDQFCWLSVDNGLIWAFVGPALTIIIVITVLLALVIKVTLRSSTLAQRSRAEKTKCGVRNLCALLPTMGVTWVIGIFYVNSESEWIQYVFAICNGLQGCFIFLFRCVLNRQIKTGLKKKAKPYTTVVSTSNNYLDRIATKTTTSDNDTNRMKELEKETYRPNQSYYA